MVCGESLRRAKKFNKVCKLVTAGAQDVARQDARGPELGSRESPGQKCPLGLGASEPFACCYAGNHTEGRTQEPEKEVFAFATDCNPLVPSIGQVYLSQPKDCLVVPAPIRMTEFTAINK